MEEKDFVKYIINKKLLDQDTVDRALDVQKKRFATPIGEIALRLNMLTQEQIGTILTAQKAYAHQMFGEIAVKLGYLKEKDIDKLVSAQRRLRAPLIKIMAEINCASPKQLSQWYTDYLNGITIVKYACAKCGISITKEQWDEGTRNCPECGGMLALKAAKASDAAMGLELNPELKKVFIETSLCCPVCGIDDDHTYVSNSAYSVKYHLMDLMPEYKWLNPEFETYDINAFNVWQCQNCGYTAIREYFEDPVQDSALTLHLFKHALEHFLKSTRKEARAVSFLKEKTGIANTTLSTAMKRLMLAAYILENIEKIKNDDSVPLARTLVRLSWSFREFEALPHQEKAKIAQELKDTFKSLSETWPDCPGSESAALKLSIKYYENAVYESSVPEKKETEHIVLQIIGQLYMRSGDRNKCREFLHEAADAARKLKTKTSDEIQELHKLPPSRESNTYEKITALKKKSSKLDKFLTEISNQLEEAAGH